MSFSKKWERFKHLDETAYWNEICEMSETQLRAEHKIIQQTLISAGAGAGASYAAGFFTLGTAWVLTAVNARRIDVNLRQKDLIERRLNEEGWSGHDLRKRDFALGVGPCVAAELIVPAGGALLGHVAQHVTTSAATHAASTTAQHLAQATGQQIAQTMTQQVAEQIASHHLGEAMSAVATHTSSFFEAAIQGAQSEIFTASHGAIGHLSSQYFLALPIDHAAAEAQILGASAGQALMTEGAREGLSKGTSQLTEYSIRKAIERSEKRGAFITEKEIDSDDSDDSDNSLDDDDVAKILAGLTATAKVLLEAYYKSLMLYERDGTLKTDITKVDSCKTCDCVDYDDRLQAAAKSQNSVCLCGHTWGGHGRDGKNEWIATKFCASFYATMEHREHDGTIKTKLSEIEGCCKCNCTDYNDATPAGRKICSCDHIWGHHHSNQSTTPRDCAWILGTASGVYLKMMNS